MMLMSEVGVVTEEILEYLKGKKEAGLEEIEKHLDKPASILLPLFHFLDEFNFIELESKNRKIKISVIGLKMLTLGTAP